MYAGGGKPGVVKEGMEVTQRFINLARFICWVV